MTIGVIGAGAVASACLLALVVRGRAQEIVVVNRNRKRARAVALDIGYGAPLAPVIDIHDGDCPDLVGAELVMITAATRSTRRFGSDPRVHERLEYREVS